MILIFIAALLTGVLLSSLLMHRKPNNFKDKHIVISGGSSGIGFELAKLAAKEGSKVTIVARNVSRLEDSVKQIEGNVGYVAVDLSADVENIKKKLTEAIKERGDIDILVNCAGSAVSRYVEDTTEEMFRTMMDVNFYSAVNLTKASLGSLERRCKETGTASVVFTSSVAGLMGVFGYSAYSPSKFALIGFGQTLKAEKQHLGLHVMVAFPPDTDTPGFENENIGKPQETVEISKMGGLKKASAVAQSILEDIGKQRLTSSFGLDGQFLVTAASGLWPSTSPLKLISEVALIGPGRLLGAYLHWAFAQCAKTVRHSKTE